MEKPNRNMARVGSRPCRWKGESITARLEAVSMPEPNSGCLLCLLSDTGLGYVLISWHGKVWKAHRLAWVGAHGPIPEGMHVLHKCDVRSCVNPDHLWLGTNDDNVADKLAKGRHGCLKGSECSWAALTESDVINILISPMSARSLARQYGVSSVAVDNIRKRKTWKHVHAPSIPRHPGQMV